MNHKAGFRAALTALFGVILVCSPVLLLYFEIRDMDLPSSNSSFETRDQDCLLTLSKECLWAPISKSPSYPHWTSIQPKPVLLCSEEIPGKPLVLRC